MKEILVLAEHRKGELRDITWEMLSKGRQLGEGIGDTSQEKREYKSGLPDDFRSEKEVP